MSKVKQTYILQVFTFLVGFAAVTLWFNAVWNRAALQAVFLGMLVVANMILFIVQGYIRRSLRRSLRP
jgi:uncharacterized membrane protein